MANPLEHIRKHSKLAKQMIGLTLHQLEQLIDTLLKVCNLNYPENRRNINSYAERSNSDTPAVELCEGKPESNYLLHGNFPYIQPLEDNIENLSVY